MKESRKQESGISQGCSLNLYLYIYIYIDDIISIISEEIKHAPVVTNQTIPALLVAYVLAIYSFAINGLQKGQNRRCNVVINGT